MEKSQVRLKSQEIKGGDDRMMDWIWRLCNMVFESGVVPEDWRSAATVTLQVWFEKKLCGDHCR